MKKNKKILIIISLLVLIAIFSFLKVINFDPLKDNFYNSIVETEFNKKDIDKDGNGLQWSLMVELQESIDKKVYDIIEESLDKKDKSVVENNMGILYKNYFNLNSRNDSFKIIQKYIDLINNSNNINDFLNNAIIVEKELQIDIFMLFAIEPDFKNVDKNITYLYPITFDFGNDASIYVDEDYITYKSLAKQYGIKLLKQYGYKEGAARDISHEITNFYVDVAKSSKTREELMDYEKLYNKITKEELKSIYNNLDVEKYLTEIGLNTQENFIIIDKGNCEILNSYLTSDNLQLLKHYVELKILENYAQYTNREYEDIINKYQVEMGNTKFEKYTDKEYALDMINNNFSAEIQKKYSEKFSSIQKQEYINKMINEILNTYKSKMNKNTWLSKETKEKAIKKLNNITINVGYPDYFDNIESNYNLSEDSLLENKLEILKVNFDYIMSKLVEHPQNWKLNITEVNAYYNPLNNSINCPLSIIELVDLDKSYNYNLGLVGSIIAHEITHAFDNNGAKFDEKGNLNNWWKKEDVAAFKKLQERVIEYYNKYEVIDGLYINGKNTVGENIADLGAISCITDILVDKKAADEDFKELYESYAMTFASKEADGVLEYLLLFDTHSPNEYRINGALSSTDKFYEIYNINNNNGMFISKEDRIKVW